jgi:hypothetical protein
MVIDGEFGGVLSFAVYNVRLRVRTCLFLLKMHDRVPSPCFTFRLSTVLFYSNDVCRFLVPPSLLLIAGCIFCRPFCTPQCLQHSVCAV